MNQRHKTVAIYTLGCKVNQSESQAMLDELRRRGWQALEFDEPAAVYIVNTCSVTQAADQKSRKILRGAKKRNPEALLVVTGCYAESAGASSGELAADLVVGNRQKERLPELLEALWQERAGDSGEDGTHVSTTAGMGRVSAPPADKPAPQLPPSSSSSRPSPSHPDSPESSHFPPHLASPPLKGLDRTRAVLKLQDGCRQFCSYCIIPHLRGGWRSLPETEALRRAGELAAAGYREIVLLGIHLGAYGCETGRPDSFVPLIERLLAAYPGVRFRLGSLEPMEAAPALMALLRDYPNACKHLHLPLQSGADRTLQAMNRPYLTADYRAQVEEIRRAIPDIALTTDIMAGFPGEGAAEFAESLAFVESMAFSRLHVFAYSRRPGTPAAGFPGQVAKREKDRRSQALISLGEKLRDNYGAGWRGRTQEVLAEEEIAPGVWYGHSGHYLELTFTLPATGAAAGRERIQGRIFPVTVTGQSALRPGAWQGEWVGVPF